VAAGDTAELHLHLARSISGSWISMPVVVLHGAHDGPVVWVSAAVHGDELNGIPIVRRLVQELDPRRLRGTLIAVPIVNAFGLMSNSRYLPDRRDLNRSFPGSQRGSLAARLAHVFMTEVVRHCQVGIDLHTGAAGRSNLPQLRCNLDDPPTRALAEAFAPPLMMHASVRDGSLRAAASRLGIAVLLYEAGEAGRFDTQAIRVGTEGVLGVLGHLGMIETVPEERGTPLVSRSSSWVRAPRSGFCELHVSLGERVSQGQVLGVVFEALGKSKRVRASKPGVVIGRLAEATVHRGDALVHVAQIEAD
jgi:predicted deacylase